MKVDTWEKTRSRSQHFSPEDIAIIRNGYIEKITIASVAEQLKASIRNVSKYYGYFRAEGIWQKPEREQK